MCEHSGILALTGKRVKNDEDSVIKEYLLFCYHIHSILSTNNNDFKVTLMKSLLFKRDHPTLNKNKQSLPVEVLGNKGTKFHHMISHKIDLVVTHLFQKGLLYYIIVLFSRS